MRIVTLHREKRKLHANETDVGHLSGKFQCFSVQNVENKNKKKTHITFSSRSEGNNNTNGDERAW